MKKGFSLSISAQNIDINSFITKDYDNCYFSNSNFDFLLEGVLLNKKQLLTKFAIKNFETLINKLFIQKKENLIKEFEGEFRGFLFDKEKGKLYAFTNATSTQRIFYGKFNNQIFIDTSLVRLNHHLRSLNITPKPNIESIYELLCFNNLPENKTPLENIFKILDGHYIEIDYNQLSISEKEYFSLVNIELLTSSKNEVIDQLHEVFKESVLMEYQKDTELGQKHLALLSGGLDSRVAMFYAIENNLTPHNVLCFSQSKYFDHTISERIANDYNLHYEFVPLDGGSYLKKIDELTEISEGMSFYTGGIHVRHAMQHLKYKSFALFHSGQIGDGVLGGFNTEPRRKKPTRFKIVVNQKFLPKVQQSLDSILQNYETEELFLMRNVAFNRTLLGAHVLQEKRYQTSPFMSKEFLKFAIAIPEEWKYNHKLYIDWVSKHCPSSTKYRWERTLLKPDAKWKTTFGDKFMKRSFRILNEKILGTPQKASMYPYQFYFDKSMDIRNYYQKYFDNNFHRIEAYPELANDVTELFKSNDFSQKSQAINILSIFKLFFN